MRIPPPTRAASPKVRRGFTLTELLVTLGVIVLLVGVLLSVVTGGRRAATTVVCTNQLRQLHLAFTLYAADNDGRLPDPFHAGMSWEQMLRRYISDTNAFRCEGDSELFEAIGSSYDWRDTGLAETTLAGRTLGNVARTDAVLVFDALPGWHSKGMMNATLVNGSTLTMKQEDCLADLQAPIRKIVESPPPASP